MKYSYSFQLACLVAVQFVVNATILIINPFGTTVDTFANTEVTLIHSSLKGYIESANPPDACTIVAPPTLPTNSTMKKFVLVNGSNECDLMTKIKNIEAVGYEVAIVYNPFPEQLQYNITFPIQNPEVNVSVVTVLYEDGILIKNNYLFQNLSDKSKMILEIIPTVTWWTFLLSLLFASFVTSLMLIPVVLLFLGFLKIISYCTLNNDEHEEVREEVDENIHGRGRAHGQILISSEEYRRKLGEGQTERLLKSLNIMHPLVRFSKDDKYDTCAICVTLFKVGEKIRILKCSHAYHMSCIDPWLLEYGKKKKTCPLCVRSILLESSVEESAYGATEHTPLLGSSCPVNIDYLYSDDHFASAQGSVNHGPWNFSDEDTNV